MNDPPTRPSPRSSRNWPPLEFETRGSPRLAVVWSLWCAALGLGLWLGCDLPRWCRLALELPVLQALWRGAGALLHGRVRLRCGPDGRWRCADPRPGAPYVQADPPRVLGPLLWLRWPSPAGRDRYQSVDRPGVEPNTWRAIKARMRFPGQVGRDRSP
ncbi:MAG TPA: hypothetical protein VMT49_05900 [Steroidobacteraceae bacterium]|nr:hypothetical protein [Steroidobacteraceae bacterium]